MKLTFQWWMLGAWSLSPLYYSWGKACFREYTREFWTSLALTSLCSCRDGEVLEKVVGAVPKSALLTILRNSFERLQIEGTAWIRGLWANWAHKITTHLFVLCRSGKPFAVLRIYTGKLFLDDRRVFNEAVLAGRVKPSRVMRSTSSPTEIPNAPLLMRICRLRTDWAQFKRRST